MTVFSLLGQYFLDQKVAPILSFNIEVKKKCEKAATRSITVKMRHFYVKTAQYRSRNFLRQCALQDFSIMTLPTNVHKKG